MNSPGTEYKNKSETELILLARTNRTAYGELYDRNVDKVYSYIYYRTGKTAETEDIVSTTFLKALEHMDSFRPKYGGFTAWLLRIARNLLFDDYRKSKHVTLLVSQESQVDPNVTPEESAIIGEEADTLKRIVATLPQLQQEAVILKYSFDLKNKDIATVLGKSETAVSSLLHRAMQSLRTEVNTHGL